MEVIIRPTQDAAEELTARIIANEIRAKPRLVLGLATGRTMEDVYAMLVRLHHEEDLDFSRVTTFNLDEYIGIPAENEHSYRYYMNKHLFNHVNIDIRNTHLPNGAAADFDHECEVYENTIRECGGIDFQLLGIGSTGHIGFNEPLSAMFSRTRAKALSPRTLEQNGPLFGGVDRMPKRAITMGVGTILEARRCVLLAVGGSKAEIIAKAVEGPVTSMISATALQLHPRCSVIVDEAAAGRLEHQEYYRWLFENEPEWELYRTAGL
ncbi:MAG: glucosamine-6-phosphate deaminase [Candidatus Hydrogenedentota bacterium]